MFCFWFHFQCLHAEAYEEEGMLVIFLQYICNSVCWWGTGERSPMNGGHTKTWEAQIYFYTYLLKTLNSSVTLQVTQPVVWQMFKEGVKRVKEYAVLTFTLTVQQIHCLYQPCFLFAWNIPQYWKTCLYSLLETLII